jgi:predicted RNA-binding Zn ribbon-like protein
MADTHDFRFNSGRLSLDLSATIRRRSSIPEDVLAPAGASASWLAEAVAGGQPLVPSKEAESELLLLRDAIWSAATAAATGREMPRDDVERLNELASRPLPTPQLDHATGQMELVSNDPVSASLATIARDAIELLGTPMRDRIKICEQPDCQMLFVDMSPSSRRRWCSMDRCGSRAKGKAFRQRHKAH